MTENKSDVFRVISSVGFFNIEILPLKLHAVLGEQHVTVVGTFLELDAASSHKDIDEIDVTNVALRFSVFVVKRLVAPLTFLFLGLFLERIALLNRFPEHLHL